MLFAGTTATAAGAAPAPPPPPGPPARTASMQAEEVGGAVARTLTKALSWVVGKEGPPAETAAAAKAKAARAAAEAAAAEAAAKAAEAEKPKEEVADNLLSSPAFLKQKLKVLEKELAKIQEDTEVAKAEGEEQKEAFGEKRERLNTDFENFKKRNTQSALDAQITAQIKLLQDFLPVVDNYDRARGIIQTEGPEQEALAAQYETVYATLEKAMADLGVTKIATVGTGL